MDKKQICRINYNEIYGEGRVMYGICLGGGKYFLENSTVLDENESRITSMYDVIAGKDVGFHGSSMAVDVIVSPLDNVPENIASCLESAYDAYESAANATIKFEREQALLKKTYANDMAKYESILNGIPLQMGLCKEQLSEEEQREEDEVER